MTFARVRLGAVLAVSMLGIFPASSLRADIVKYQLPGSDLQIVLQGTAQVNPGGTRTLTHPKLGTLYFNQEDSEIIKVPTVSEQFNRQLGKAGGDANKRFAAAQWALRHGLLKSFYQ